MGSTKSAAALLAATRGVDLNYVGVKIMSSITSSVVVWQGESALDGQPIVLIATNLKRKSQNVKTGHMTQTFILRADVSPCTALASGADHAICGDCPLRKAKVCYVDVSKSVSAVWHSYRKGNTPGIKGDYSDFPAMITLNTKMLIRDSVRPL